MMWFKYPILAVIFFVLALAEASFFSYFNLFGAGLKIIFILFILLIFFREKYNYFDGLLIAIILGFFADVFSVSFFGSYVVSFLIISFFMTKFLNNLKETEDKYPIYYFILFFVLFFIFNELFLDLISYFIYNLWPTSFSWIFLIKIVYNLFFAIVGFYVFKRFFKAK